MADPEPDCVSYRDKVHERRPPRVIVLDMTSSESPTFGEPEGRAYNGHFGRTRYLFVFNQLGTLERCALRSGNVHSADGWWSRWSLATGTRGEASLFPQ